MSPEERNWLNVCMSNALETAQRIHIAMCRFSADHSGQHQLVAAMHSALIIAEQCRQAYERAAPSTPETEGR